MKFGFLRYFSLFLSIVTSFSTTALTAPADFDPTFGTNGKTVAQVGNGNSFILDTALQPDGKIVAVGAVALNGSDFCIARYDRNGTFDAQFGQNGIILTDFGSANDSAKAVFVQPDGKILAAGTTLVNNRLDFAVARYNPDGSLDQSFGSGGKVITSVDQWGDLPHSIALMADGRIIVAGYSEDGSFDERFAAVRYNPNGSIDTSFGTDGKIIVSAGANSQGAKEVLLMPDGKIVLVGSGATGNTGTDFILVRLNSNGSLDNSFDADGKVVASISVTDIANAAVLQPDGKILVAGYADDANSSSKFAAVRFHPNGVKDNDFGFFGIFTAQIGANFEDAATAVALQPDGKILLAGATKTGFENYDLALMRLNPGGGADASFGTSGKVILPVSSKDDSVNDALIQPNGRILLAGASMDTNQRFSFTLVRLLGRNSSLDFDSDGKADLGVFRPSNGNWFLQRSLTGFSAVAFGQNGDKPVSGDFDGDGRTDIAVYRPANGTWYVLQSANGFTARQFGVSADVPVPADYDGDGKTDLAVFRPANGTWFVQRSQLGFTSANFGANGDRPQPGDFDRDGRCDYAVFRPANGTWYVSGTVRGFFAQAFGQPGDVPAAEDFDGDLISDYAVFRPSNGTWYILQSALGFIASQFGTSGDVPAPRDLDGDGRADMTVFRPSNGTWYAQQSANGFTAVQFGAGGDLPATSVPAQ